MKTKSNMIVTKPNNEWEKKFNKLIETYEKDAGFTVGGCLYGEMTDFISKTLQQQREEVIEEIKNHEFYIPQGHTTRYFKLDDKDLEFLKKENK